MTLTAPKYLSAEFWHTTGNLKREDCLELFFAEGSGLIRRIAGIPYAFGGITLDLFPEVPLFQDRFQPTHRNLHCADESQLARQTVPKIEDMGPLEFRQAGIGTIGSVKT